MFYWQLKDVFICCLLVSEITLGAKGGFGQKPEVWLVGWLMQGEVRKRESGGQEGSLLEPKRGEVSHQISGSGGQMGQKDRGNDLQAPVWILLNKKEFQQQTHMNKEPLASWLFAIASSNSAPWLLAVWSTV